MNAPYSGTERKRRRPVSGVISNSSRLLKFFMLGGPTYARIGIPFDANIVWNSNARSLSKIRNKYYYPYFGIRWVWKQKELQ